MALGLMIVVMGILMMVTVGVAVGGYLYINRPALKSTVQPTVQPTGIVTVKAGKIEATGNTGPVEIELHKKVGETTEGRQVNPNVLNLVHQFSIDECKRGDNYGIIDDNTMYASDGCRGMFTYKNQVGMCGSVSGDKSECPIGKYKIDKSLKLAGLVNMDLEMIKDKSKGKCIDGTWGKIDYNNIYVKDGCKGLFQFGTLFGYCSSHKGDDGIYTEKVCKIGKTEPDTEFETGDSLRMKNVGLRIQNPNLRGDIGHKRTCVPYDSNDDIYYNISADNKTLNTWNGCSSNFNWGPYKGSCNANVDKQSCPIGSLTSVNGVKIGMPISGSY